MTLSKNAQRHSIIFGPINLSANGETGMSDRRANLSPAMTLITLLASYVAALEQSVLMQQLELFRPSFCDAAQPLVMSSSSFSVGRSCSLTCPIIFSSCDFWSSVAFQPGIIPDKPIPPSKPPRASDDTPPTSVPVNAPSPAPTPVPTPPPASNP
ncbi:hypothetical protein KCU97_g35, partial [Aureobasidium melanogenum]